MPVVLAVGLALVVWSVGLSLFYAGVLHRRGEPTRRALRSFLRRPTLWLGLTLVAAAISSIAAAVLIGVAVVFAAGFVARRARADRP